MYPIGSKKAVGESLAKAILEDGISEVAICGLVVPAQRGSGHADLNRRLEVFQNLPPVALLPRATAMALVNDDEVKEIGCEFLVQSGAVLVLRDGLIRGEIHFPAFDRFTV